ncbi:Insecticidal toxin complex protein [Formosa sp. L2A11]|uniref:Insecticidal toxin complex protein n=1 Tax=Formosa sp. L2A11 TaxID=2686363 RepID=UPI00131C585E|nr:Insecticidal toxin complex protein [Formosa sp. L2A11]
MKIFIFLILCLNFNIVSAKEWKNLKTYQKETQFEVLSNGDWFTADRKQNSKVWQNANRFNLMQMHPENYTSVVQRLGFYMWFQKKIEQKGDEVYWVKMAAFISEKLSRIYTFPYKYIVKKSTIHSANYGSEIVFNNAFPYLRTLFLASEPLKNTAAETWDLKMLHLEQYDWVASVYEKIDAKNLKQISQIARGKGVYRLFVPKELAFTTDLKNPNHRYYYAVNVLLPYCKWSN